MMLSSTKVPVYASVGVGNNRTSSEATKEMIIQVGDSPSFASVSLEDLQHITYKHHFTVRSS